MNKKFTSKTYGEVRYVIEDGNYLYFPKDIARGLGRGGITFGGRDMADIRKADLYCKATFGDRKKPQWALSLKCVKFFRDKKVSKKRKEHIVAFFEWLKGQEESARNAAPTDPEPVKTEQPTESKNCLSKFDATFDAFASMMSREIEERQQMLEACNGLRDGALRYKEMYKAEKAQSTALLAQVDELKQQLADNDITDIVNNITRLRYMLGNSQLQIYEIKYRVNHNDTLRYRDTYTPTQMSDFVKNMGKFDIHLSAQVINRKLEEAGYQEHCASDEEGAYKLTSLIDESYAYKTYITGNNDFICPSLVWTKKGLTLLIGLLFDTELINETCI